MLKKENGNDKGRRTKDNEKNVMQIEKMKGRIGDEEQKHRGKSKNKKKRKKKWQAVRAGRSDYIF